MRFNFKAYDKLFPRTAEPEPVTETPVETFRPSQSKTPEMPVDPVPDDPLPADPVQLPEEQEVSNDDGSDSESDTE